ncbi:MAG: hypothetical protein AB1631_16210 [Acidobacteriota bacterium]
MVFVKWFLFCGNLHKRFARSYHIAHPDQNSLDEMGDTMEIALSFHEEIPLSPRGKFRLIVQELQIPRVPTDEAQTRS